MVKSRENIGGWSGLRVGSWGDREGLVYEQFIHGQFMVDSWLMFSSWFIDG